MGESPVSIQWHLQHSTPSAHSHSCQSSCPVRAHVRVGFYREATTERMEVKEFVWGEGNKMDGRKPELARWWHVACQMKPCSVREIGSNGANLWEDYLFKCVKSCLKCCFLLSACLLGATKCGIQAVDKTEQENTDFWKPLRQAWRNMIITKKMNTEADILQ